MNNTPESRREQILLISDRLLEKIQRSIDEIDRCIIKTKERTKTVEYDAELKKPLSECTQEKENIEIIDGMIDKMGLKQLVSTLKDIKDIHICFCEDKTNEQDTESGIIVLGEIDEDTLESDTVIYDTEDDGEDLEE